MIRIILILMFLRFGIENFAQESLTVTAIPFHEAGGMGNKATIDARVIVRDAYNNNPPNVQTTFVDTDKIYQLDEYFDSIDYTERADILIHGEFDKSSSKIRLIITYYDGKSPVNKRPVVVTQTVDMYENDYHHDLTREKKIKNCIIYINKGQIYNDWLKTKTLIKEISIEKIETILPTSENIKGNDILYTLDYLKIDLLELKTLILTYKNLDKNAERDYKLQSIYAIENCVNEFKIKYNKVSREKLSHEQINNTEDIIIRAEKLLAVLYNNFYIENDNILEIESFKKIEFVIDENKNIIINKDNPEIILTACDYKNFLLRNIIKSNEERIKIYTKLIPIYKTLIKYYPELKTTYEALKSKNMIKSLQKFNDTIKLDLIKTENLLKNIKK